MKKLLAGAIALSLLSPMPAFADKTVPYKNQKNGQFCKMVDIKKTVTLPNGTKLICKKDGTRARWKLG